MPEPDPAPDTDDMLGLLSRDVIEAVSDRPLETEARRESRALAARRQIEAFEPRDAVEIMLAGHAVSMGSVLVDALHCAGLATTPELAERHRRQAIAAGRLQIAYVKELRQRLADRLGSDEPEAAAPRNVAAPTEAVRTPPAMPPAQPLVQHPRAGLIPPTVPPEPRSPPRLAVPAATTRPSLAPTSPIAPPGDGGQVMPPAAAPPATPDAPTPPIATRAGTGATSPGTPAAEASRGDATIPVGARPSPRETRSGSPAGPTLRTTGGSLAPTIAVAEMAETG